MIAVTVSKRQAKRMSKVNNLAKRNAKEIPSPVKEKGKLTGLGVCQYIATLLRMNEELPPNKKLTDNLISQAIVVEFPATRSTKRLKTGEITIGYWRTLYNLGHLTQKKKPKKKSYRYDQKGKRANLRTGKALELAK